MEWIREIKPDELPEHYQQLEKLVGMENTLKLAGFYNKQGFYFSGLDELIRKKKREYIIKNFNGKNHKELARITEYSEQWVYEILKGERDERQDKLF